jgi:uncharacterized protein (TIGR02302 family)
MSGRRPLDGRDPLRRIIRQSQAAMAAESFTRAFWPLASVLAVLWAALAFGLAEVVTRAELLVLLAIAGLAALWFLVQGLRRFRWPSAAAARARVDASLPGRPLASLRDTPALGRDDPGAQAVWAVHLARMRRLAALARPARADLRLASRDPWAFRLMALVLLIAAALFARDRRIDSLAEALQPAPEAAAAAGPTFEGWAEPPAYTGLPTLYLPEVTGDAVAVPEGTRVTLRAYGTPDRFELAETVSGTDAKLAEAAPGIASAEFSVDASGAVALHRGGDELGAWSFEMREDWPPEITMAGGIERAPTGETRLAYEASDDYGIVGARAEITLDLDAVDRRYGLAVPPEPRPALVAGLPLPMAGAEDTLAEVLVEDFSKHPFAGLPVEVRLVAEDATGQAGSSPSVAGELPMRSFYDPLAAALIEQRRDLLWSAANARRVTQVLRAVTHRPDDVFESPRAYLVVRTALRRLAEADAQGDAATVRDEVAEALWQAAVQIEDGDLGDAAARLARAKERLQQALREGASDEEIARLMDELRQATREYMEQMAREAIENGEMQQAEIPPGQTMTQDQIQELMDRIQELSEQGRKAEAEALLEMLQEMLDNMQMMMGQGGGTGENGEGQQSMQGLADALREQQGLADESFRELQRQFRNGEGGQPGEDMPGDGNPSDSELAERQEALRQLMEGLQEGLPGEAGEAAREALRQAERNMADARDGLREGDTPGALDRQAEAIDNLREGMRQMGEDLRRADAGDGSEQGQLSGESTAENGRDPLGRPLGSQGSVGTNSDMLPEGDSAARARALLDEIRRRAGEQGRPQLELDYLNRLLDLF